VFASTRQHRASTRPIRERRSHDRLAFQCLTRWNDGSADRYGISRDISQSGAALTVRALSAPRPGEQIRLVFELDSEREWIVDENATVVRCDSRDDGLFDVGVRLQPM
jgi:hypothetical protein